MQLILKFETRELNPIKEMTVYNHLMYEIKKPNAFGFTHLKEIYDDVSDYPDYQLGRMAGNGFYSMATGEGEPIPENKFTCGGVWVEIMINRPDLFIKQNND